MKRIVAPLTLTLALGIGMLAGAQTAYAQATKDSRVANLVRAGELRVGLGLGVPTQAIKDPKTGELRGVALELARILANRIGVRLVIVEYPRPGAVLDGLRTNAWDVSFLGVDPRRAAEVDFSHVILQSEITYLVAAGSSIRSSTDADRTGIRIAVPRGDQSDLILSHTLKLAQLVRTESHAEAIELLRTGKVDAKASPGFVLATEAASVPGARLLADGFAQHPFAAIVPKGRAARLAYVNEFVEEAKASGLVMRILDSLGLQLIRVAPAQK